MSDKTYSHERFSEMPERGKITVFDNCFFNGVDVVAEDWDCFRNCYFVGGSLTLFERLYKVVDCTMENSRLVTRIDGLPAGVEPILARGSIELNAPMGAVRLKLYNVDISASLTDA